MLAWPTATPGCFPQSPRSAIGWRAENLRKTVTTKSRLVLACLVVERKVANWTSEQSQRKRKTLNVFRRKKPKKDRAGSVEGSLMGLGWREHAALAGAGSKAEAVVEERTRPRAFPQSQGRWIVFWQWNFLLKNWTLPSLPCEWDAREAEHAGSNYQHSQAKCCSQSGIYTFSYVLEKIKTFSFFFFWNFF